MIDEKKIIGRHKYQKLKSFDFEKMNAEQMVAFRERFKISVAQAEEKIAYYERAHKVNTNTEENRKYFKNLSKVADVKKITIDKKSLWKAFHKNVKDFTGEIFEQTDDFIQNLEPVFKYFIEDVEGFKKCDRVSSLSEPSLEKGLLIVGDFGNGKTTIMRVLEKCFRNTHKYFKGYNANELVLEFEGCEAPKDRKAFIDKYSKGTLYFDDIKSERKANNYGKSEVFREILENRYNNKAKTFITCNYKKGYEGNILFALNEFGEKYGDRVNDRIYEMFNIIEFKGKSFRK